ncbi:MAG: HAD-IA family hydrolase [Ilumatobacteraceae bacterium]
MPNPQISAVFWDFGGVILSSPFEAFNRYEDAQGLPRDVIRRVNSTNPDSNAWALLERSEISPDEFDSMFAAESERLGHRIPGADVLSLLAGDVRPRMVAALDKVIAAGYVTACLTNNVVSRGPASDERSAEVAAVMARFHHVVESSKVGVRKPEREFYEIACRTAGVEAPQCVFLDDLGVNLKPAAAMGMHTIKVVDPDAALGELSMLLLLEL